MDKHTPAPWTYQPTEYSTDNIYAGKKLIAQMVGDSAETEANAYLVAASPEMHDALNDALGFIVKNSGNDPHGETNRLYLKVMAALAKSKGRA